VEITEVRIFIKNAQDRKLKAYSTVTFDNAFVVRDIKVIEGNKGLFVAMPSRRLKEVCPKCGHKNVLHSKYCNNCGSSLPQPKLQTSSNSEIDRQAEHKDIAHPITQEFREYLQKKILEVYEQEKAKGPSAQRDTDYQDRDI